MSPKSPRNSTYPRHNSGLHVRRATGYARNEVNALYQNLRYVRRLGRRSERKLSDASRLKVKSQPDGVSPHADDLPPTPSWYGAWRADSKTMVL